LKVSSKLTPVFAKNCVFSFSGKCQSTQMAKKNPNSVATKPASSKAKASTRPGTATKTGREQIRQEASATQHASRASERTPERSGQARSSKPKKK